MSYQLSNVNKLNQILLLSDSQINASVNNNIIAIDKTTLDPKYKLGLVNDLITSPLTVAEIRTNTIRSIGVNDDLLIDANGNGKILLSTLSDGGIKLKASNNINWSMSVTNNNDSKAIVLGTILVGDNERPSISSKNADITGWHPLYIQNVSHDLDPSGYVVMGDIDKTISDPLSVKLVVGGGIYNYGDIKTSDGIVFKDNNTTLSHRLTGVPTGLRVHTLPDQSGKIVQENTNMIGFWNDVDGVMTNTSVNVMTFSARDVLLFRVDAMVAENDTCLFELINLQNGDIMGSIPVSESIRGLHYDLAIVNLPVTATYMGVRFTKTAGTGGSRFYSVSIFGGAY